MEGKDEKFSDIEFLAKFNKISSSNIGDNVLRIFRAEMRRKGFLNDRERLDNSHFQVFQNMISIRNSQNLRWQEAAEKTILRAGKFDSNKKIESLMSKINGTDDSDSKVFGMFYEIAKKYNFDVTRFFHLQTEITDELEKLPFPEATKHRIHSVFEDIMHMIIAYSYVD